MIIASCCVVNWKFNFSSLAVYGQKAQHKSCLLKEKLMTSLKELQVSKMQIIGITTETQRIVRIIDKIVQVVDKN